MQALATGDPFCIRTAPMPFELASTEIVVSVFESKSLSTGAFVMYRFSAANAVACWCSKCHSQSFSSSVLNGAEVGSS